MAYKEDLANVTEINYNDYLSLLRITEFSRQDTFKESPYLEEFTTGMREQKSFKRRDMGNALIYDLQGRQLRHNPEKGLYIQNGKMRMAT